ncbi:substrate-binding domain-containing protein [Amaricoccus solimangrovi]|uniref:Sugar ABC transporter substrate-binding protein n=1 Tax=Amaricoccus solimangrovi TaxID=2589815 RepID=A0A501WLL8_9RHOB|nr:substrate-binding domain-containing protein [Amaricoccus solimangrovi]TPE47941.1 sugar ABC transporter substrate-binding protein [Amaricoccus solimangrovi]
MKRLLTGTALALTLFAPAAMAENIGISMALFDDNFLTILRNGMQSYATDKGLDVQVEDAQNDVGRQLSQIENFIASGVDAIIVVPVDTDATMAMTAAASSAGIPLVYVNRQPINVDDLPENEAFVGSEERQAGMLETREICRLLREAGKGEGAKAVIMMGELSNQAARERTAAARAVIESDDCAFIDVLEEQTGNWQRTQGTDLMTNWLAAGIAPDAIISNNDEMAIGAAQALRAAGVPLGDVVIGGVDGTTDGLAAVAGGDLDVTVFHNARAQGEGAVETAIRFIAGEAVPEKKIYVPFELVTPANLADYQHH